MVDVLFKLALLAAAAWVISKAFAPRTEFVLVVRKGALHVKSGKVTAQLATALENLCREHSVTRGRIRGIRRSDGLIALSFSREFPHDLQQRIRNSYFALS